MKHWTTSIREIEAYLKFGEQESKVRTALNCKLSKKGKQCQALYNLTKHYIFSNI